MITVLIVDDEAPARDELRYLLDQSGETRVLGEAGSGEDALRLVQELKPQAVFLDVQMPAMDGLQVAEQLVSSGRAPHIVFATAYDRYALRAFEYNAVDYLLKPFDPKRVASAVQRLKSRGPGEGSNGQLKSLLGQVGAARRHEKVPAEGAGRLLLLDRGDILYACTEGREVLLKTPSGGYRSKCSLSELEQRLGLGFLRVHKSYIVNLDRVKEVIPWFHGEFKLVLNDQEQTEVPVGRSQVKEVREVLGI